MRCGSSGFAAVAAAAGRHSLSHSLWLADDFVE